MINPKSVQDIVRRAVTKHSDMLVAQTHTYEVPYANIPDYITKKYIKDEICHELSRYLTGKSFIEESKGNSPDEHIYAGRVLVIPYLQVDQFVATLTSKIIEELHHGNHLDLSTR